MSDFNFRRLWDYVESHPSEIFPYRLLSESEGLVYRYDLAQVLAIVVSQLIEGRTVLVMPPERPGSSLLQDFVE